MVLGYFIIAFIVFFIVYKLKIGEFKAENEGRYPNLWVERSSFWVMVIVPLFWIVSIPLIVSWKVLDRIYNKLTN